MKLGRTLPQSLEQNLIPILIIVLLSLLYGPVLIHWADGWLNKTIGIEHEYFSHGLIGFPYAAYVVWNSRKKWQNLENNNHPLGGVLLGIGAVFYLTGAATFVNISLPIILVGICLWLKGMPGLKLQWFPLLVVFLATPTPVPYLLTPYTLPLQKFIAGVAGFLLMQMGFKTQVEGIYLSVDGQFVEVAPYCAGLKMLFTSLYVTLLLLHWTGSLNNIKKTVTMLFGATIISVIANIIRNTLLAMFHGKGRADLFDYLHEGTGGDIYSIIMLIMIVVLFHITPSFTPKNEPEKLSSTEAPKIEPEKLTEETNIYE